MKILIAAHKGFCDYDVLRDAIKESGFELDGLVCEEGTKLEGVCKKLTDRNGVKLTTIGIEWNKIEGVPEDCLDIKTNSRGKYNRLAGKYQTRKLVENSDAMIYITKQSVNDNTFFLSLAMKKAEKKVFKYTPQMKDDEVLYVF